MSTNPRDTQFREGFAKLLWDELEQAIRQDPGFIPDGDHRRNKHIPVWQELIARRAYDLACHTVDHVSEAQAAMREVETLTANEIVAEITDMTEWPRKD